MKRRNIRKKIAKAVSYSRTLVRVKHYRGRKVHSPFVYGIVRNAIMKTDPKDGDTALFDELRARGFSTKRAAQLQNLYTYRGFTSFIFAEGENQLPPSTSSAPPDGDMRVSVGDYLLRKELSIINYQLSINSLCFLMPSLSDEETLALVEKARGMGGGAALCLVSPYESRHRRLMARHLVESHRHTSIDNRGFLLLFTDERLPKQHFKL